MPCRASASRLLFPLLAAAAIAFAIPALAQQNQPQGGNHHQHKDPKRVMRGEIESLEHQWREAQLSDDIPTMDKLLSDDFLGTTANGQVVTKAQQLDRMKRRAIALTQLDVSDVKIKLIGQVAIVNSLAQISGTMDSQPLAGGFRYTRVYQRLPNGTWKITSFSATRVPGANAGSTPHPPPAS